MVLVNPMPVRDGSSSAKPGPPRAGDRKSTRLNSSHSQISYAVFCLKKKTSLQHHVDYAIAAILPVTRPVQRTGLGEVCCLGRYFSVCPHSSTLLSRVRLGVGRSLP